MRTRRRPKITIRPEQASSAAASTWGPAATIEAEFARERRSARGIVVSALAAIVLIAGLTLAALLTMPSIDRVAPNGATSDDTPTLRLEVAHAWGLDEGDVRAVVDGVTLQGGVSVSGNEISVAVPALTDGEHTVEVEANGVGLLHRTVASKWTLTVDTTPPGARVRLPKASRDVARLLPRDVAALRSRRQVFAVGTEPHALVEAVSDAPGTKPVQVEADKTGVARIQTDLAEGEQSLRITSTDDVGNVSHFGARVLVDSVGPALAIKLPVVVKDPNLDLAITLRDARGVDANVVFDAGADGIELTAVDAAGNAIEGTTEDGVTDASVAEEVSSEDAHPDAEEPEVSSGESVVATLSPGVTQSTSEVADASDEQLPSDSEGADEAATLPLVARYRLTSEEPLYEGRHELTITARDALGNETKVTRAIILDSAEKLADVEGLRKGARGSDVRELHLALIKERATTRAALGADFVKRAYGQPSRAAVSSYQSAHSLDVDGMAGRATIASLLFRIVVDQSSHSLTLYSGNEVVKRYGVAVGQPAYPTPLGEFHIVSMQENPTWTPPDSDWAKDAKPIPPGPDNPLGTRWMGLDAPGGTVGIHGTNNPSSIGSSVSHGCIRMAIPDVEDLFERVEPGTPVTIQL